jgi:hypothetical protein
LVKELELHQEMLCLQAIQMEIPVLCLDFIERWILEVPQLALFSP